MFLSKLFILRMNSSRGYISTVLKQFLKTCICGIKNVWCVFLQPPRISQDKKKSVFWRANCICVCVCESYTACVPIKMGCLVMAVGRALSGIQSLANCKWWCIHSGALPFTLFLPLFLLWITVLSWRSPQPFSSYFVKWFVCFYSLFVSTSVAHQPAHVKDDRRQAVNVHDSDVCAEFTAATDIQWGALGRGVMHCSDPCPWT